jgi:hypothetical protein
VSNDRVFVAVMCVLLTLGIFGVVMAYRLSSEFVSSCKEIGGVPIMARNGQICLDPSALRQLQASEGASTNE